MLINPSAADEYLAKKGLKSRVTDAEWDAIFQRVVALFGSNLWHRCRLITQGDDALRRFNTNFPDGVPTPYRFMHHVELLVQPSEQMQELERWLSNRGVEWQHVRQNDPDTGQEEVVGMRIYGFEPESAA